MRSVLDVQFCTGTLKSKKQAFCDGSYKNHETKGLTSITFTVPKSGKYILCRCKQTNDSPFCDGSHLKTWIPKGLRKLLNIDM
ncbi:CISD3 [Cordylochernes scorpioides]|uniref:CISD3 n=1 Tax=Cordylochernes scorpioides TaxID=51811 RepID=A0ABY6LP62_9ARAC|nr:CISD3 [Cordylochernes scorpioides]